MFHYMSEEDQLEFRDRFPGAVSFMMSRSLRGELRHLRGLVLLGVANEWQINRLEELTEWERSVSSYGVSNV